MTTNKIKVSIIIRTINEESWIGKCISSIKKQSFSNYEIIIVDSGSTDNTIPIANSFSNIKIVNIRNYLPGLALNKGIEKAKGEIIVMISARCIPFDENWLCKLISNFDEKNVVGVYGKQLPVSFSDPKDIRDLYITFGDDKRVQKKDSFFHNANSAIRKSIWKKIPFKNEVTNIEDRIWAKEVIKLNYFLVYEPSAAVYHYHGIHQSDNIERMRTTINIIQSLDEKNELNGIPNELLPENSNIISLIPFKNYPDRVGDLDPMDFLVNSIKNSKYIKNNYFICEPEVINKLKIDIKYEILGRPLNDDMSLGEILNWGLNKVNSENIFPDYIIYLNPEYIFRPEGYLDKIVEEIIYKGLDSVFTGYQDYSDYWFRLEDRNEYAPVNTKLLNREDKFPLYKSLFGLGSIVRPKLIRKKTLVSNQNVEIISTTNIKYTLRANNESMVEIIKSK